ncbi:unnamed protein product [Vitrella brassicaformis CCMP3155]|uniref:TOG domain-containing protein n=4 Tax=Vitrella brassicaformis TaxID=1169539 RepID=A0A0G4EB07_VITBC|nr:unnamed protein product [Vitrella brassicaformis CCMP3155]|eukprot:CEL92655.1 unnamed protein product [Vitrella brassicaformis CCMP3155]
MNYLPKPSVGYSQIHGPPAATAPAPPSLALTQPAVRPTLSQGAGGQARSRVGAAAAAAGGGPFGFATLPSSSASPSLSPSPSQAEAAGSVVPTPRFLHPTQSSCSSASSSSLGDGGGGGGHPPYEFQLFPADLIQQLRASPASRDKAMGSLIMTLKSPRSIRVMANEAQWGAVHGAGFMELINYLLVQEGAAGGKQAGTGAGGGAGGGQAGGSNNALQLMTSVVRMLRGRRPAANLSHSAARVIIPRFHLLYPGLLRQFSANLYINRSSALQCFYHAFILLPSLAVSVSSNVAAAAPRERDRVLHEWVGIGQTLIEALTTHTDHKHWNVRSELCQAFSVILLVLLGPGQRSLSSSSQPPTAASAGGGGPVRPSGEQQAWYCHQLLLASRDKLLKALTKLLMDQKDKVAAYALESVAILRQAWYALSVAPPPCSPADECFERIVAVIKSLSASPSSRPSQQQHQHQQHRRPSSTQDGNGTGSGGGGGSVESLGLPMGLPIPILPVDGASDGQGQEGFLIECLRKRFVSPSLPMLSDPLSLEQPADSAELLPLFDDSTHPQQQLISYYEHPGQPPASNPFFFSWSPVTSSSSRVTTAGTQLPSPTHTGGSSSRASIGLGLPPSSRPSAELAMGSEVAALRWTDIYGSFDDDSPVPGIGIGQRGSYASIHLSGRDRDRDADEMSSVWSSASRTTSPDRNINIERARRQRPITQGAGKEDINGEGEGGALPLAPSDISSQLRLLRTRRASGNRSRSAQVSHSAGNRNGSSASLTLIDTDGPPSAAHPSLDSQAASGVESPPEINLISTANTSRSGRSPAGRSRRGAPTATASASRGDMSANSITTTCPGHEGDLSTSHPTPFPTTPYMAPSHSPTAACGTPTPINVEHGGDVAAFPHVHVGDEALDAKLFSDDYLHSTSVMSPEGCRNKRERGPLRPRGNGNGNGGGNAANGFSLGLVGTGMSFASQGSGLSGISAFRQNTGDSLRSGTPDVPPQHVSSSAPLPLPADGNTAAGGPGLPPLPPSHRRRQQHPQYQPPRGPPSREAVAAAPADELMDDGAQRDVSAPSTSQSMRTKRAEMPKRPHPLPRMGSDESQVEVGVGATGGHHYGAPPRRANSSDRRSANRRGSKGEDPQSSDLTMAGVAIGSHSSDEAADVGVGVGVGGGGRPTHTSRAAKSQSPSSDQPAAAPSRRKGGSEEAEADGAQRGFLARGYSFGENKEGASSNSSSNQPAAAASAQHQQQPTRRRLAQQQQQQQPAPSDNSDVSAAAAMPVSVSAPTVGGASVRGAAGGGGGGGGGGQKLAVRAADEEGPLGVGLASTSVTDVGVKYCYRDDLQPFPSSVVVSERYLQELLGSKGLQSNSWEKQFNALNSLRRVAKFHPTTIVTSTSPATTSSISGAATAASPSLHAFVKLTVRLVDNLRSSLAKNALICLNDLFVSYRKQMDPELETCVPVCLKKAADTNTFIAEEAERTLRSLCSSASEGKTISLVVHAISNSKHQFLKRTGALCLGLLIRRLGGRVAGIRDIDKLVNALGQLGSEASPHCREMARAAIITLARSMKPTDLDRLLKRHLSDRDLSKVKVMIEKSGDVDADAILG